MSKQKTHMTPRFALSLALLLSMSMAASGGQDKEKVRAAARLNTVDAERPIARPASTALSVIGGTWTAQGPSPIHGGQTEGIANGPVSGALNAVVAHPTNSDILWVGSVNGGIWKTTNATAASPTWSTTTDAASSLSITDLQRDPTDGTHNTLVAVTGNYSSWGFSGPFGHMLRTTNGGTSWSVSSPLAGTQISGVAPRGATIVVSAIDCGSPIYRSTNTGASFAAVGSLPSAVAWDVAGDPTNNATLYAAITECSGTTLSGVYRSLDTGATWTRVSSGTMNTQLTTATNAEIAVGNSGQVFVAIVNASEQLGGLFRSANGTTWTQLDTPTTIENGSPVGIHPGAQGELHLSLAADPSNTQLVYIGGDRQPLLSWPDPIGAADYSGRLFRVNGALASGSQATPLTHCQSSSLAGCSGSASTSSNSAPHADSRAMAFMANGTLVETDDGGIYRRTNPSGTGDWFSLNGTLQIAEMHDVVYDRISNMVMGGNQDTGTPEQTSVGGTTWTSVSTGDGGDASIDDTTSTSQSTRYSSYKELGGFRRRIVNSSGTTISTLFPALTVTSGAFFVGQFSTPVELNQLDQRRMLIAGENDLYESLDRGDTMAGLGLNRYVDAAVYGGRSGGSDNLDVIWAISNIASGVFQPRVFLRTSGGGAPTATSSQPTTSFLRDITSDVTDWQKAYVLTQSGTVHATSNAGASWSNVTGNLGSGSTDLHTIALIPGNPSLVIVGGLNGVFRMATNNPGVWNQLGTGLSNAIVYDLDYEPLDDVLVAGTLGRGAWKLTPVQVSGSLPSLSINDVTVTEGNSGSLNATFTVSLSASTSFFVGVDYTTANGTATFEDSTTSNNSTVTINDGTATPYPSTISVSGVARPVQKVTVTLNDFAHTWPDDVDILLVGPGGQSVTLMSDAGNVDDVSGVDLTFDDAAPIPVPDFSILSSGTYQPSNYEGADSFPSPAPASGHSSALSVFNGVSPNGTWSLYVVDDAGGDTGSIAGGWSVTLWTGDYAATSGSLTFYPGTTSKTVSVSVLGDSTAEANETFFVNLANASNATISDSQGQGTINNDDPFAAPTNVVATATTSTNVNVTWTAVSGAPGYRVYRSSNGSTYTLVGSPSTNSFNDSTVSANTAYLYKVRTFATVESADSNVDLATTVIFTDPTLTAGTTTAKTAHFTELLTAVNAVRALASQSAISFTSPAPAATTVTVRAAHVTDLRNGLSPARSALGLSAQSFTDVPPTTNVTPVKAAHINELRNGVQ